MGLLMRRNLMAAKSGYTAKDYVQDGLIAMWDGIENAGFAADGIEHDPNATVWKDLVGGYDLSLVAGNYSWNANNIEAVTRTASEGYIANNGTADLHGVRTVEVVCDLSHDRDAIIVCLGQRTNSGRCVYVATDGRTAGQMFSGDSDGLQDVNGTGTVCFTYEPSTALASQKVTGAYFNAVKSRSQVSNPSLRGLYNGVAVAGRASGYSYFGRIFAIRLYSVELQPTDIAANYEIDNARFGLTA